jgi:hypothetical protein
MAQMEFLELLAHEQETTPGLDACLHYRYHLLTVDRGLTGVWKTMAELRGYDLRTEKKKTRRLQKSQSSELRHNLSL